MKSIFEFLKLSSKASLRLLCFPFAGGGPFVFSRWLKFIPSHCDLIAIHLPGRDRRSDEECYHSMNQVIGELISSIPELFDMPFMFFGHSLGGLIAFELIRKLQQLNLTLPNHFIISSSRAPQHIAASEKVSELDDETFLQRIRSYKGTPDALFEDEDFRSLFLRRMRADMKILDNYQFKSGPKINCPVSLLYGNEDPYLQLSTLFSWRDLFLGEFTSREFKGGHFYINDYRKEVVEYIFSLEKETVL